MPFTAQTSITPWKRQANELPEPEPGGHMLEAVAKLLWPEGWRTFQRWNQGIYDTAESPWQVAAADAMPDDPGASVVGGLSPQAIIRWRSGAVSPNALLHRTLDPELELPFIQQLIDKGVKSEAPTSIVTPGYTAVFHGNENPYGLLFHVKDPENLTAVYPADVNSIYRSSDRALAPEKYQALAKLLRNKSDNAWQDFRELKFKNNLLRDQGIPSAPEDLKELKRLDDITSRYNLAAVKFSNWIEKKYPPIGLREWAPGNLATPYPDVTKETSPLRSLQLEMSGPAGILGRYSHGNAAIPGPRNEWPYLWHNEAHYRMGDPSELAGVRMPLKNPVAGEYDKSLLGPAADFFERQAQQEGQKWDAMNDFATKYNLPRYELPQPGNREEQLQQILNMQGGSWE